MDSGGSPESSSASSSSSNLMTFSPPRTMPQHDEDSRTLAQHLQLLERKPDRSAHLEMTSTPLFTMPVMKEAEKQPLENGEKPFPQYGLLGGIIEVSTSNSKQNSLHNTSSDPRLFFNVATPSSTFICGSQGSGKSHTLSCLLENCLLDSIAGELPKPLTGLVFHYDTFISDDGGSPCEAAYLSSNPKIKVRVLCSPTNIQTIKRTYKRLNVEVYPLQINESDLNTKRMIEMMAISSSETIPLYVHTIYRILREMRTEQQETLKNFDYSSFKRKLLNSGLSPAQMGPLNQRLDTLESFMDKASVPQPLVYGKAKKKKAQPLSTREKDWEAKPGCLTIVDLSCPCVTPESACSLFNVCLSLFVEQSTDRGRVIALDEAHKYMNASDEALTLTDSLLSVIRLQRHLGARVIISTQEPTISPKLLDLCSVTIAHRFTSPDWLACLKGHLAAVAMKSSKTKETAESSNGDIIVQKNSYATVAARIFDMIVELKVGEALLFAPSAMAGTGSQDLKKLGTGFLKVIVRNRLTTDGGKSVIAA